MKLRSAIDALSALHLYYHGQEQLATAVNYYDQALAIQTPLDQDDHLSDGVFLRHFLLYVYDIVMTVPPSPSISGEASMSATNLSALQRLAVQRYQRNGEEKFAYVVWILCLLDLEACFMGNGDCQYVRELLRNNVMPSLSRQVQYALPEVQPRPSPSGATNRDIELLKSVLDFKQGIVVQLARLASLAKSLRDAMNSAGSNAYELLPRCQAAAQQAQTELKSCWTRCYPNTLDRDSSKAAASLPPSVRPLCEHVSLACAPTAKDLC